MKKVILSIAVIGIMFSGCEEGSKELSTDIVKNDATAE